MAHVNVTHVTVLDNPTSFMNPFQFEICFECFYPIPDDLEWKLTYVGSAEDAGCDQILDQIFVGPIPVGTNKFVFQADPPKPELIPPADLLGVTVILLTCAYRGQEFLRVGYYTANSLSPERAEEVARENLPIPINEIERNILADAPRVTTFPIAWDDGAGMPDSSARSGSVPMDHS